MSVEHRHLLDISHGLTAATSAKGHSFAVLIRTGSRAGPAHLCKGQSDRSWDTLKWLQAQSCLKAGKWVGSHLCVLKNLLRVTPFSRTRRLKPMTSDIAATSQSLQPLFFFKVTAFRLGGPWISFVQPSAQTWASFKAAQDSILLNIEDVKGLRFYHTSGFLSQCKSLLLYIQWVPPLLQLVPLPLALCCTPLPLWFLCSDFK